MRTAVLTFTTALALAFFAAGPARAAGSCAKVFSAAGSSATPGKAGRFGVPREGLRMEWTGVHEKGTGEFFVLYSGNEAVAYLGLHRGGDGIQFVTVRPEYREQGLGSSFYKFVAAKLALSGAARFRSDAINAKSRGVWEAFEREGLAVREGDGFVFDLGGFARAPEIAAWAERTTHVEDKLDPRIYEHWIDYDASYDFF